MAPWQHMATLNAFESPQSLRHSWSGEQGLLYFAKLYALTPQLDLQRNANSLKISK